MAIHRPLSRALHRGINRRLDWQESGGVDIGDGTGDGGGVGGVIDDVTGGGDNGGNNGTRHTGQLTDGGWELVGASSFENAGNATDGQSAPADGYAVHDTEGLADAETATLTRQLTIANPIPADATEITIDSNATLQTFTQITGAVGAGTVSEHITAINGQAITPVELYTHEITALGAGGSVIVPASHDITALIVQHLQPGQPLTITTQATSQLAQLLLNMRTSVNDAELQPVDISWTR